VCVSASAPKTKDSVSAAFTVSQIINLTKKKAYKYSFLLLLKIVKQSKTYFKYYKLFIVSAAFTVSQIIMLTKKKFIQVIF